MKSFINHAKQHWKNYTLVLLVLVVMFNGSIVQLTNTFTGGYQTSSMAKYGGVAEDMAMVSSRTSLHYNSGDSLESDERKIVKNANINLETKNYDGVKSSLISLTKAHEGIVLWENENKNYYDDRTLSMRVKVDSNELDTYLNQIQALDVEINSMNINGNDVTGSYTDYTERLERYQTQITKYESMLKAEKISIEEEVQVQSRIDQLEDQIFYLKDRIGDIDEDVTYSEIYLSLSEEASIGDKVGFKSFSEWMQEVLSSLQNGLQIFIAILGFILPFAILYGLYRLVRKFI